MIQSTPSTAVKPPLRCAIIGMGGFAGYHHLALLELEQLGAARLVATCDPQPDAFAAEQKQWRLQERDVDVFTDYVQMLKACAGQIDLVVIPTPIPLHAAMHKLAVEYGIPVYLEKPPTLDPQELEQMIATDRSATKATLVGFNFIAEKPRQALKQRLLTGEFGQLKEARLLGLRARNTAYFKRNDWAGRLRTSKGHLLLDSSFGNATAHYVHNILFWAGEHGCFDWSPPEFVRAELYRAHEIEGADTFFTEAVTQSGVTVRIALSHACCEREELCETLITDKAQIDYVIGSHYEVIWKKGLREHTALEPVNLLRLVVNSYLEHCSYLRGEVASPITTLADCRPFVHLNGLSYISSGEILPIPAQLVRSVQSDNGTFLQIDDMDKIVTEFLANGRWPGECYGWRPDISASRMITASTLPLLNQTIDRMLSRCAAPVTRKELIR